VIEAKPELASEIGIGQGRHDILLTANGEVSVDDLIANARRMRPDRILIVKAGEPVREVELLS